MQARLSQYILYTTVSAVVNQNIYVGKSLGNCGKM